MSELTKLLDGVTVEWKALGDVADLKRGRVMSKTYLAQNSGIYPVYSSQTAKNGEIGKINSFDFSGEYLTWTTDGANAGTIFYRKGSFSITNVCGLISIKNLDLINYKFLFYWLKIRAKNYVYSGMGNPKLMSHQIEKIQIPIPCADNPEKSLKIQQEIVRSLDRLSEETNLLTAALQKELQLHQKQYNFYREELFNPKDKEVVWKSLKDLGSFTYGYAASALDSGDTRFVRITDINANGKLIESDPKYVNLAEDNKKYLLKKDDLLMARTGATFGKTMIFTESYAAIYAGFLIRLNLEKTIILPKFYWHFAQSILFWHQANNLVSGGGQPQFNANALKRVMVPIPYGGDVVKSHAEQDRIVNILDQMDTHFSSITTAIQKEIALRNKQYEYYRDRLLSFQSLQTKAEAI
ncbi:restriction endonuclease subunit S [Kaistella carnis]|uniref:restriction endonuclease subunit S n=1 Tax=Kaistella carnis TaxID=1241979 RepID=UPI0028A24F3A|nr:restriction endonuclease subunit S [Kaistella carnis]